MAYWIFVGTYGTPAYVVKCDSMPVVRPHGFDDGDWRKFVSEESMKQLEERNEKLEKVVAAAKSWLAVADTYAKHRDDPDRSIYKVDYMQGREIFRGALYELGQP